MFIFTTRRQISPIFYPFLALVQCTNITKHHLTSYFNSKFKHHNFTILTVNTFLFYITKIRNSLQSSTKLELKSVYEMLINVQKKFPPLRGGKRIDLLVANRITNTLEYTRTVIYSITQLIGINIFLLRLRTPLIIIANSLFFRIFHILENIRILSIP